MWKKRLNFSNGARYASNKSQANSVRSFNLVENVYDPNSENTPKIGDIMYTDKTWSSADNYDASKTIAGVITSTDNGSVKVMSIKNVATGVTWGDTTTNIANLEDISPDKLYASVMYDKYVSVNDTNANFLEPSLTTYKNQYNEVLIQYDNIVEDASYLGVNLLKKESLSVRFNENGESKLDIISKDMRSTKLGLNEAQWAEISDIADSVMELRRVISAVRTYVGELGNNYAIVQSRESFTESLINILTEGADKLTLADMNEESANVLSLQIRQQLAVNALSLASQASQSVLKLF